MSLNIAALSILNSSILLIASVIVKSSMPSIDTSNAAAKGGIFGDPASLPGGLGLRAGEGVGVRVLEVDESQPAKMEVQFLTPFGVIEANGDMMEIVTSQTRMQLLQHVVLLVRSQRRPILGKAMLTHAW